MSGASVGRLKVVTGVGGSTDKVMWLVLLHLGLTGRLLQWPFDMALSSPTANYLRGHVRGGDVFYDLILEVTSVIFC